MRHAPYRPGIALAGIVVPLVVVAVTTAQTPNSILSIVPSQIGKNSQPTMVFDGAQPSATTAVAFAAAGQCSSSRVGETNLPVSDSAMLGSPIASAGLYKVCYTEDGATWIEQNMPQLIVVQGTASTITGIDPSSITQGVPAFMTFTGAQVTPTTKGAFALSGQCASAPARQGETSLTSSDSNYMGSGVSPAGIYAVCYTTDGVTWLEQAGVTLTVTGAATTTTVPTTTTTTLPAPTLDDYKCYKAKDLHNPRFTPIPGQSIGDQFATDSGDVKKPAFVCIPAEVPSGAGLMNPTAYQCCYKLSAPKLDPGVDLSIVDGFGSLDLEIKKPSLVCRPCVVTELP